MSVPNGPLVTIVTIARNDLQGLIRTVESIDSQELSDWMHIIVDGASEDGSREWLDSLPSDPRRRWTSERDAGIYDAMNRGVVRAECGLVMMLNAGDELADSLVLLDIYKDRQTYGWNWAYGDIVYQDATGHPTHLYRFKPFNRRRFISGKRFIPHPATFIDLELMRRVGEFSTEVGLIGDQEFLMRCLKFGSPRVLDRVVARFSAGGASGKVAPRKREMNWHYARRSSGVTIGTPLSDRLFVEVRLVKARMDAVFRGVRRLAVKLATRTFG